MISNTIITLKRLEEKGIERKDALIILLIEELKEIKEVLKNARR